MSKNVKELNATIGGRIRAERERLGLSREAFAENAGISASFVNEIERGRSGMSSESLASVSKVLGVSIDYLIFGDTGKYDSALALLRSVPPHKLESVEDILRAVVKAVIE